MTDLPPPLQPGDDGYNEYLDNFSGYEGYNTYYDRDVNPITLRQWAMLHEKEEYVRIAQDHLDDGHIWVSTVWLGMNHRWGPGPPLIFETMLFVRMTEEEVEEHRARWRRMGWSDHDFPWEDLTCDRYSTENEAREGHRRTVDSVTLRVELLQENFDGEGE